MNSICFVECICKNACEMKCEKMTEKWSFSVKESRRLLSSSVPDHSCPFLVTGFSAGGGISSFGGTCCNVFRDISSFAEGYIDTNAQWQALKCPILKTCYFT